MEKEKEILAIDVDEVLSDTLPAFLIFYNKKYNTNFKFEDFYVYEYADILGITREEAIDNFYEFLLGDYNKKIYPKQGSVEAVEVLKNKYKIIISTNRPTDFQKSTIEWLETHFPDSIHSVHFGNHYSKNKVEAKNKSDILKELGVKYLIEDQIKVAIECANEGIEVFLINTPWNKDQKISEGLKIQRVDSWDEVVEKLTNS